MKKLVALMLMSGFLGTAAQAEVGRQDTPRVDCSKVIQSIQEQLKRARPGADQPSPSPDEVAPVRPAQ